MQSSVALAFLFVSSLTHVATSLQTKQSEALLTDPTTHAPGDCGRGFNCGYTVPEGLRSKPPISVPCPNGAKNIDARNLVLRGRDGASALYCFVNKVASTFMFNIMKYLDMHYRDGARDRGFFSVEEVAKLGNCEANPTDAQCQSQIEEICNASASLLIIRNPWDRVASAYVDRVINNFVFAEPPSFDVFMKTLAGSVDPAVANEHWRPMTEMCHPNGKNGQQYSTVLKLEDDDFEKNIRDMFVKKLNFPENDVDRVMARISSEGLKHASDKVHAHDSQDKSIGSGLDRTAYYFQQTNPEFARTFYSDDIAVGDYAFPI